MSEHLFRFLLSELAVVRVACVHCGGVVEMPTDELARLFRGACGLCQRQLIPTGANPFKDLADAVAALNRHAAAVRIEFVLKAPPP